MSATELESDRLLYIPLSMQHWTDDYVSWLNDAEVNKYLETKGGYNKEMLLEYLLNVVNSDIYFWGIHIKGTGKHIGNIKIDPINKHNGIGEYGIMMGDKNEWGKGYAKEASKRIIDYCFFEGLNLRKITLGVVADNKNAVKLYEKLGFFTEGLYRKHAFHDNKYCDIIRMGIFKPENEFENK